MPFQRDQLSRIRLRKAVEFVNWKTLVADSKREHDRGTGGYPLELQLRDVDDELLLRQIIPTVHDRKSVREIVAIGEWDGPLRFIVTGPVEPPLEYFIEDFQVAESAGRQMTMSEIEKEEA
jgi:hypothetical protein